MTWDGTHEDAMHRCGFSLENFDYCMQRTRMKYPGNDPENGPAREYCPDGHSTCYLCGKWFQAIVKTEAWTDEETGIVIPAGSHESDWCEPCTKEHMKHYCSCGSDKVHTHTITDDEGELSWACCGGMMCCDRANE